MALAKSWTNAQHLNQKSQMTHGLTCTVTMANKGVGYKLGLALDSKLCMKNILTPYHPTNPQREYKYIMTLKKQKNYKKKHCMCIT